MMQSNYFNSCFLWGAIIIAFGIFTEPLLGILGVLICISSLVVSIVEHHGDNKVFDEASLPREILLSKNEVG